MSNNGKGSKSVILSAKLREISSAVHDAARDCEGNAIALLALLRQLEDLHQEIRGGAFQQSLPDSRQALYSLLRDIESEGGWPYIERMRLQAFLVNLEQEAAVDNNGDNELIGNENSLGFGNS